MYSELTDNVEVRFFCLFIKWKQYFWILFFLYISKDKFNEEKMTDRNWDGQKQIIIKKPQMIIWNIQILSKLLKQTREGLIYVFHCKWIPRVLESYWFCFLICFNQLTFLQLLWYQHYHFIWLLTQRHVGARSNPKAQFHLDLTVRNFY